ncbi:MAG: class I SAM-dependent methyltransferase [bacterium]
MPEAHITSIEFSRHAFEELRHNLTTFSKLQSEELQEGIPADFGRKITSDIFQETIGNFSVYFGDAREVLPYFQAGNPEAQCERPKSILNIPKKTFEVIFIDGAFRMTREFYDLSIPLLNPGGIIIIDDVIKYRWKMNGFYEYLDSLDVKYEVIQTDPDDGIMVIQF